jgi:NMD protein affecting ribosome stability and mRNA decay
MLQTGRRDKMIQPERQDVYRNRGKYQEPTVCEQCGALFEGGRWSWGKAPAGATRAVCPACRRIADRFPAGRVELSGDFFRSHRDEILNLVRNAEAAEKAERPMERIMTVTDEAERTVVMTTGIHVARRIGESLSRSYQGEMDCRYGDGEDSIRVVWAR